MNSLWYHLQLCSCLYVLTHVSWKICPFSNLSGFPRSLGPASEPASDLCSLLCLQLLSLAVNFCLFLYQKITYNNKEQMASIHMHSVLIVWHPWMCEWL